jgi:hypothetical protein
MSNICQPQSTITSKVKFPLIGSNKTSSRGATGLGLFRNRKLCGHSSVEQARSVKPRQKWHAAAMGVQARGDPGV